MRPSYHSPQILQRNVGADLGAADLRMTRGRLDMPEVRAVTKHMGRHDLQYPTPLRLSAQELSAEPDTLYLIRRLNQMTSQDVTAGIKEAATLIRSARYLTTFTDAGIRAESGIPPFRGDGGLWSRDDPGMLELDYFLARPKKAWPVIREIFYGHFGKARPNRAHEVLAAWEARGLLKCLITQNIDSV